MTWSIEGKSISRSDSEEKMSFDSERLADGLRKMNTEQRAQLEQAYNEKHPWSSHSNWVCTKWDFPRWIVHVEVILTRVSITGKYQLLPATMCYH